jgi:hypothetical protein
MVKGKIKPYVYLKFIFITMYILYALFMTSKDTNEKFNFSNMSQKDFLLGDVCLSILGGSNVKWGISAEQLNTLNCRVKNYGIDYEGGSFENYIKWLSKDLKSQSVLYSSYLFVTDSVKEQNNNQLIIFPTSSIISEIKKLLIAKPIFESEYNSFGDLINYDCQKPVRSFNFNSKEFSINTKLVAIEVNKRIKLIGQLTNTHEIYLRIPPVYVDGPNLESYKSLMRQRIEIFREMGINVIETTIASSELSLFCDSAHHPNAKGRIFFTNELRRVLSTSTPSPKVIVP